MPQNWEPPYPSWSADFEPEVEEIIIGCFAAQSDGRPPGEFREWMQQALALDDAPRHREPASYVDAAGYANHVHICYWTSRAGYEAWAAAPQVAAWWEDEARLSGPAGYWREVIFAPMNRLETLFSSEDGAGMAAMAPGFTGPIQEHGYWGGMRDRVPDSAADDFRGANGAQLARLPAVKSRGRRVRIAPPGDLCLIRSAQNWGQCRGAELDMYLNEVHPVLIKGMDYIRDNPLDSGCLSCRFMDELGEDGSARPRTFGMALFLTMGRLEAWAKSHPSHLAIFRSFHEMVRRLEFQVDLKLWHEVVVLPEGRHVFEYVNCHENTGLLPWFPPL